MKHENIQKELISNNRINHIKLYNLDEINSAVILYKIENSQIKENIINFLRNKFNKPDFELYNINAEKIDVINLEDSQSLKIYFQDKANNKINQNQIAELINKFIRKDRFIQDIQSKQKTKIIQNIDDLYEAMIDLFKSKECSLIDKVINSMQTSDFQLRIYKQQIVENLELILKEEMRKSQKQQKIKLQSGNSNDKIEKDKMNQQLQQLQTENQIKNDKLNAIINFTQYNKYNEENQKLLQRDNQTLQRQIQEIKQQYQQQIDSLNRELYQLKNQSQSKFQIKNDFQQQQQQQYMQLEQFPVESRIIESQYSTQFQKQDKHKNKCGHYLNLSQIEEIVRLALMKNQIAKCNQCLTPLQSKLCLLIQSYGEAYLQTKNQQELQLFLSDLDKKLNQRGKLVKCQNSNCNFHCVWMPIQKLNGKFNFQQPGFCPNCLTNSVVFNFQQPSISQTQYAYPKKLGKY